MSPQTREFAESFAEHLISLWDDSPGTPSVLILATYENQLDYETLRPEDQPARVEDHTEMIHHIQTLVDWEFDGSGPDIQTPVLRASDYLRWLAVMGLTNNAGNRAMFISNPFTTPPSVP